MLIYQGKVLKDNTTIDESKVAENSFVVIMLTKVGSAFKFWRVVFSFIFLRFLYLLGTCVSLYTYILLFNMQYIV